VIYDHVWGGEGAASRENVALATLTRWSLSVRGGQLERLGGGDGDGGGEGVLN